MTKNLIYYKNIQELKTLKKKFIEGVNKFPEEARLVKYFDQWSIRELMAHISAWNLLRIKEIKDYLENREINFLSDFDAFNKIEIEKRALMIWEEIYIEFVNSMNNLIESFEKVPSEFINKKIWKDKDRTVNTWLEIDIEHYKEHLYQFEKFE